MIRTLLIVSGAAFVASVATLSAAVAIVGPEAVANGAFSFGPGGWRHGDWRVGVGSWGASAVSPHRRDHAARDGDETRTRDIPWSGGESLDVDLPADVRYVQSAGAATITVSGPTSAVDAVVMDHGRLRLDEDVDLDAPLVVKISAPAVKRFMLESSGALSVADYRQDTLGLQVSGSGDVTVAGEAGDVKIEISGSGEADLAALKLKTAHVQIDGSGGTRVGPTEAADVDISGSGVARLLTRPPQLQSRISGSGRIVEAADR